MLKVHIVYIQYIVVAPTSIGSEGSLLFAPALHRLDEKLGGPEVVASLRADWPALRRLLRQGQTVASDDVVGEHMATLKKHNRWKRDSFVGSGNLLTSVATASMNEEVHGEMLNVAPDG